MVSRRLLLAVISVVVLCVSSTAQTPFSITVNTKLVIQTVSVTDNDGHPIEGLTKDDFILTEDNVPQSIGVFAFQKIDDTVALPLAPTAVARELLQPADSNRIAPVPAGDTRFEDRRL